MKHFKLYSLLLILSLFAACSSTSEKQMEEEADIYFGMGTNALINKNYTVAITNLLEAVARAPKRSDIHNNLGMAYYFKKQPKKALEHIELAIKLNPKNTDAKSNLASLYVDMKKYDLAKKYYQEVLNDLTYPKQYITYYNLGKIEYDQKNFVGARSYFQHSIKENANSCAAQYYVGLIEFKLKNYKTAQNYFKDAYYGICYSNEYPLFYHGLALEKAMEYPKAMGRYQELTDRFPNSPLAEKARQRIKAVSILDSESRPVGTLSAESQREGQFVMPDEDGENPSGSPSF